MKFTNGNYLDLGKLGLENGKTLGMWIKTTKYTSSDPALFGNKSWSNGKADGLLLTYKDAASYRVNIGNAGSSRLDEFPTYTKGSWQYITPVSYTHLDVYKRQAAASRPQNEHSNSDTAYVSHGTL